MPDDLFDHASARAIAHEAPLAEAVRPRTLDDFVGQEGLVGVGRFLRRAIDQDRVPSLILWGPPGTGKTTLAQIIADRTERHFEPFSAVLGGVKAIRLVVAAARERRKYHRQRTVLFVDEIHHFNKGQQDALLPHVESGLLTLIGATTENPAFELNRALLSRARVVVLEPLGQAELRRMLQRAAAHAVCQARWPGAVIEVEALECLAQAAGGDARRALSTLEAALEHAGPGQRIDEAAIRQALERPLPRYDKRGDSHFQIVSAFIKSMRGSDPDAAVYWLQRMLEAGEDPLFILRRLIIFASEDVGHADPRALQIAVAACDAFRFVGLPEGAFALLQATTYLACAPKSNTLLTTLVAARQAVLRHGDLPVPARLRNVEPEKHGRYPHHFEGRYVPGRCLPDELPELPLFRPNEIGEEALLKARRRDESPAAAGAAPPGSLPDPGPDPSSSG